MIEGKVEIYLSTKEPEKNLLWLRPYLDKDGYELLYFGANGWTPLMCGHCPYKEDRVPPVKPDDMNRDTIVKGDVLVEIPDRAIEGTKGSLYEITPPDYGLTPVQKPSCGCPDVTNK